ncbi:MAG: choice-of-anchor D domain-containing protein [Gammaproteobacteria bacterium]
MSIPNRFTASALALAIGAGALTMAPSAHALRGFVTLWQLEYPASLSDDNVVGTNNENIGCALCHNDTNLQLNPYGQDWLNAWTGTTTDELVAALRAIEDLDSDSDPTGSSNIVEINASTQPGWAEGSNPAGVIGLLDPAAPVPDIAVSPLSVDFGAVTVGTTGTGSVNIANVGTDDLTVNSLSVDGSSEFSLPGAPLTPFTVAPSTSVDVDLAYSPVDEGQDNASLDIASDSPGEELVAVALAGTGVAVQPEVCVPSVDPASLDFGSVDVGESPTLDTSFSNSGGASCTVAAAVVSPSGEFQLLTSASFTVAPGGSVPVEVSYTPFDAGDDSGQLSFTLAGTSIDVPLSGSGVETPTPVLDLDIKSLKASKNVSVTKGQGIVKIELSVENNGEVEGSASATITGLQNAVTVYEETQNVTDAVGNGSSKFTFPSYTPETDGEIVWTAVIDDSDPDDDVATAITTVRP